jgi:hypothetical protein
VLPSVWRAEEKILQEAVRKRNEEEEETDEERKENDAAAAAAGPNRDLGQHCLARAVVVRLVPSYGRFLGNDCRLEGTCLIVSQDVSGTNDIYKEQHFSMARGAQYECLDPQTHVKNKKQNNFRGLSPRANYTDGATAACRRS